MLRVGALGRLRGPDGRYLVSIRELQAKGDLYDWRGDEGGMWSDTRFHTLQEARDWAEESVSTYDQSGTMVIPRAWDAKIFDTGVEEASTGPEISVPSQYKINLYEWAEDIPLPEPGFPKGMDRKLLDARASRGLPLLFSGMGSAIVSQNGKYQMRDHQPWEVGALPSEVEVRGEVIWIGERMANIYGGDNYYIVGTETRLHDADPHGLINYLQDQGIDARMVRMNDGSVAIKRKDAGGPLIPEVREEMLETFGLSSLGGAYMGSSPLPTDREYQEWLDALKRGELWPTDRQYQEWQDALKRSELWPTDREYQEWKDAIKRGEIKLKDGKWVEE
jgi:hypothetical protein